MRRISSGFVFFPRMPDIIRLRASAETISTIGNAASHRLPWFFHQRFDKVGLDSLSYKFHDRHDNSISELAI